MGWGWQEVCPEQPGKVAAGVDGEGKGRVLRGERWAWGRGMGWKWKDGSCTGNVDQGKEKMMKGLVQEEKMAGTGARRNEGSRKQGMIRRGRRGLRAFRERSSEPE